MYSYILRRLLLMIPTMMGITIIAFFVNVKARETKFEQQKLEMMGMNTGAEMGEVSSGSAGGDTIVMDRNPEYEDIERLIERFEFDVPVFYNTNSQDRSDRILAAIKAERQKVPDLNLEALKKSLDENKLKIEKLFSEKKSDNSLKLELEQLKKSIDRLKLYEKESVDSDLKWSYEDSFVNEFSGMLSVLSEARSPKLLKQWALSRELILNSRDLYRKRRNTATRVLKKFRALIIPVLRQELPMLEAAGSESLYLSYLTDKRGTPEFKTTADFMKWSDSKAKQHEESELKKLIDQYLAFEDFEDDEALDFYDDELEPLGALLAPILFHAYHDDLKLKDKNALIVLFETFADCKGLPYFDEPSDENVKEKREAAVYWYYSQDNYLKFEEIETSGRLRCFFLNCSYGRWVRDILHLNFRKSEKLTLPVIDCITKRFPISIRFGLIGFLLAYTVCIPLGVMKAMRHGGGFDFVSSFLVFIGYSIPGWALGMILLTYLGGGTLYDVFPLSGYRSDLELYEAMTAWEKFCDAVKHGVLPTIAYAAGSFATLTMLMKNSLMENLGADYIRTAFSKGLSERRVIFVHAMRNSLIPLCVGLGHAFSLVLAGSYLVEMVFDIDGFGLMGFNAVMNYDINLLMGVLIFASVLNLFGNLFSDILYSLVDPRVRFK